MKLTRWTIALYMGLVFVCGGVVGAYAHRLYTITAVSASTNPRNPEEFRRRFMADLQARLKLSSDQLTKLGAILDETGMRFRATRATIEPEMRKIRDDQQQAINGILSPEQQAEWQKITAERRSRQGKQRGGPGSGPRPAP